MSRSQLWDRCWGHAGQLLANIFTFPSNSPRSLCESLLGSVSFSDSIVTRVCHHWSLDRVTTLLLIREYHAEVI